MKSRILATPVLGLLLAMPAGFVRGQEEPAEDSGTRFSCVIWEKLPYPVIYYRQDEAFLALELQVGARSQAYPLKSQDALELYIPAEDAEGNPGYKLVGKAALVPGTRQMLFLIEKAGDASPLPLRLFGVDDSLSAFPVGTFRFVNFTHIPLQVEFGETAGTIPPAALQVMTPEIPELGGFMPFFVKTESGTTVFETRLFGQPRGRKMVFMTPPSTPRGRLKVKFLPQIIPPPPPKPPDSE